MTKLVYVAIVSAFVNNVVLGQMFGVNAFLKSSDKVINALRLSLCVTVVTFFSSVVTWPIANYVLSRFDLAFMQTIVFLLAEFLIAAFFSWFSGKTSSKKKQVYVKLFPLTAANSAVLGIILTNVQVGYSFLRSTVNSVCGCLGFAIAILILAGVRERIAFNDIPKSFEGIPILLVTGGLMAIAFYGFTGLL